MPTMTLQELAEASASDAHDSPAGDDPHSRATVPVMMVREPSGRAGTEDGEAGAEEADGGEGASADGAAGEKAKAAKKPAKKRTRKR
jgi:hypothetical protein